MIDRLIKNKYIRVLTQYLDLCKRNYDELIGFLHNAQQLELCIDFNVKSVRNESKNNNKQAVFTDYFQDENDLNEGIRPLIFEDENGLLLKKGRDSFLINTNIRSSLFILCNIMADVKSVGNSYQYIIARTNVIYSNTKEQKNFSCKEIDELINAIQYECDIAFDFIENKIYALNDNVNNLITNKDELILS